MGVQRPGRRRAFEGEVPAGGSNEANRHSGCSHFSGVRDQPCQVEVLCFEDLGRGCEELEEEVRWNLRLDSDRSLAISYGRIHQKRKRIGRSRCPRGHADLKLEEFGPIRLQGTQNIVRRYPRWYGGIGLYTSLRVLRRPGRRRVLETRAPTGGDDKAD